MSDSSDYKLHFVAADKNVDPMGNIRHACQVAANDLPGFQPLYHALQIGSRDYTDPFIVADEDSSNAFLTIGGFCRLLLENQIKTVVFMGDVCATANGRVYSRNGEIAAIKVTEEEFPSEVLSKLESSTRRMELDFQQGSATPNSGRKLISNEARIYGDTLVLSVDGLRDIRAFASGETRAAPESRFRLFTDGTRTSESFQKLECIFPQRNGDKSKPSRSLAIPWNLCFAPKYIIDQKYEGMVYAVSKCYAQDDTTLRCELFHIGWVPFRPHRDSEQPLLTNCEMVGVLTDLRQQKYSDPNEEQAQ